MAKSNWTWRRVRTEADAAEYVEVLLHRQPHYAQANAGAVMRDVREPQRGAQRWIGENERTSARVCFCLRFLRGTIDGPVVEELGAKGGQFGRAPMLAYQKIAEDLIPELERETGKRIEWCHVAIVKNDIGRALVRQLDKLPSGERHEDASGKTFRFRPPRHADGIR